jgi:hypothetical protein
MKGSPEIFFFGDFEVEILVKAFIPATPEISPPNPAVLDNKFSSTSPEHKQHPTLGHPQVSYKYDHIYLICGKMQNSSSTKDFSDAGKVNLRQSGQRTGGPSPSLPSTFHPFPRKGDCAPD